MAEAPQKNGKGLVIALALSMSLNLLIAGAVAGAMLAGGPRGARDAGQPRAEGLGAFNVFAQAMTEGDRRAIGKELRQNRGVFRQARRDARAEVSKVVEALRREPFDAAALNAVFAAQQTRAADRVALGQRMLLERVTAMNEAQRRDYADRLEAISKRGPARR